MTASQFLFSTTSEDISLSIPLISLNLRPIKRVIECTVFLAFVIVCLAAAFPTKLWSSLVKDTIEDFVQLPSAFWITTVLQVSYYAMQLSPIAKTTPNILFPLFINSYKH